MVVDAQSQFAQRFINHMRQKRATGTEILARLKAINNPVFVDNIKKVTRGEKV